MHCIICNEARGDIISMETVDRIRFELDGVGLTEAIHSCPTCGYTCLHPGIPASTLEAYYTNQSRWPSETIAHREQAELIHRYMRENQIPKVMDIGAYDGRFLREMARIGASELYGVEPDMSIEPDYYRFETIELALAHLRPNSIDILSMGHVFEHLQDPFRVLEQVKELLVPGGLLLVEVPNLEDPQVQIVPYWTPFHHSYFTPTTLSYILEVAGFQMQAQALTGYRSVRMLARNFSNPVPNWDQAPPSFYARAGIDQYLLEREIFLDDLARRLGALQSDKLAIFGTGDHTYWLLNEFPGLLESTVCFLNSDTTKQGYWLDRGPVFSPDDCPDEVDTIICSSYDSQEEMAQAVGKRAFLLYDDVRAYDVWMGEENGV